MVEINNDIEAEIAQYLDPSVDDETLYARLADSAGLGADEINKVSEGKTRFSVIWTRQSRNICSNSLIQAYIKDPSTSDATVIVAQIINILVQVPGINLVLVACLAIRIGLRKLCAVVPA